MKIIIFYLTVILICNSYTLSFHLKIFNKNKVTSLRLSDRTDIVGIPITSSNYIMEKLNRPLLVLTGIVSIIPQFTSANPQNDDEIEIEFITDYLGLGLIEIEYKKSKRVIIQSIKSDSESATLPQIKPGMILISVDGINIEGLGLSQVGEIIKKSKR